MIPIEKFETQSMTGNFVPIVPGGGNIPLTYQNRKEYVEKALNFRLHELDQQVITNILLCISQMLNYKKKMYTHFYLLLVKWVIQHHHRNDRLNPVQRSLSDSYPGFLGKWK